MDYLLLQILLFLILAAIVGFFIGWITRAFGFESRLLASENQWRSRHHVLQTENNQLRKEIETLKQQRNEATQVAEPQTRPAVKPTALPFRSTLELEKNNSESHHPLERLRTEISGLEGKGTTISSTDLNQRRVETGTPPIALDHPEGIADDLKVINGIGPKIESTLNSLGIFHLKQIAAFTDENIKWVNEHLQFKGRIERENWVSQAKELIENKS